MPGQELRAVVLLLAGQARTRLSVGCCGRSLLTPYWTAPEGCSKRVKRIGNLSLAEIGPIRRHECASRKHSFLNAMEAAAIVGITAASISLITVLSQSVLKVKDLYTGIRDVSESLQSFADDLDAFQFALTILDYELRKKSAGPQIAQWCNPLRLESLLVNATKTFSKLEQIFSDVSKHRSKLADLRKYYRASRYEEQVTTLHLRMSTYTSSLNMPVLLLAMYGSQQASIPFRAPSLTAV